MPDLREALDLLWGMLTHEQMSELDEDTVALLKSNHQTVSHREDHPDIAADVTEGGIISIAAQLSPIGRYVNEGDKPPPNRFAAPTDQDALDAYAKQFTAYMGHNLEQFADPRGGDVYLAVQVTRGEDRSKSAGQEYRSGHYVKEESDARPNP